jgi:ribosomal protein S18 acetylase RimI-like enzyme
VPESFDIRLATTDDAAAIASLNADVQGLHADALPWRFKQPGPATFTAADAAALIMAPTHITFLAQRDGAPAGYVVGEIIRHPETARHHAHSMIYVHQISVRPTARRHGIGRGLLDAVKAYGASVGTTTLALDAWAFNEGALAFFQRYGLVPYNVRLWNGTD